MNRKQISTQSGAGQHNGEYAVQRNYRSNIVAALLCILLAFFAWLFVMGREDTDYIAIRVSDPVQGYTYTLSANYLEVEGTVAALRHADYIEVRIPVYAQREGTHRLTESDITMPEGVRLSDFPELTVTVTAK